jgi:GT2 family glycosyltransferase
MNNNLIEVYIFNFNGKNTILSTIKSLSENVNVKLSISVIDDHSTDDSIDLVKNNHPEVAIHILPHNTKKLNLLRNKALILSKNEFVFITDNDLNFDKNCLSELLKVMESDSAIATCTPRLMHWDQPEKVYTAGTKVHYIGAAISEQRDKTYNPTNDKYPSSNSGGGICLIRREAALKVGGFDEKLLMGWGDDGEFYQRLLRAGFKCLYVPAAFALHENKIVDTIRKFRVVGQTYNRWLFILSHYSIRLIILLIPVFFLYELVQSAFVLMKGVFFHYLKGNLLVIKNFKEVIEKRKFVQKLKTVSDKEVMFAGNLYVAPALIQKYGFIKIAISGLSSFLNFYWRFVKNIIP